MLQRLDRKVLDIPSMADALDEYGELAKREFWFVTIVPKERGKMVVNRRFATNVTSVAGCVWMIR